MLFRSGSRVVSGAYDATVRLWDVATGLEIQRGSDHGGAVWSIAFLPDSQRILSVGDDFAIRLWTMADKNR